MTKQCKCCGDIKDESEFYKHNTKNGLRALCITCWLERDRKSRYANPDKASYKSYKCSAKYRGLDFTIDFDQFVEIIKKPCHYCGKDISSGIDRINNGKGYDMDNCVPCCTRCNFAKNTMGYTEFITLITNIYNNINKVKI